MEKAALRWRWAALAAITWIGAATTVILTWTDVPLALALILFGASVSIPALDLWGRSRRPIIQLSGHRTIWTATRRFQLSRSLFYAGLVVLGYALIPGWVVAAYFEDAPSYPRGHAALLAMVLALLIALIRSVILSFVPDRIVLTRYAIEIRRNAITRRIGWRRTKKSLKMGFPVIRRSTAKERDKSLWPDSYTYFVDKPRVGNLSDFEFGWDSARLQRAVEYYATDPDHRAELGSIDSVVRLLGDDS